MTSIRIMTYNIQNGRGGDGRVDLERTVSVIGEGAPDILALQEVDPGGRPVQLSLLAKRLGMRSYGDPACGGTAFLSYYPLSGVRAHDLGGGSCLRADASIGGKLLHLFNLHLANDPQQRRRQIKNLLGPDLLTSPTVACPSLILGDFGDFWWGAGNLDLTLMLRRVGRPFWNGTYPARFPLAGRDRAYSQGDLRVLGTSVLRHSRARLASGHLPLILTVQISDPRNYLRIDQLKPGRMEIAPG
jgi:endonuclease/exonuclease/phosphatase family metal-dependent hydrolase